MNEIDEEIKKRWEKIEKLIDAINENLHKYGYFELHLKDNSIIYGSKFSMTYYTQTFYFVEIHRVKTLHNKINAKSIRYIGPEIFIVEQEDEDENE